MVLEIHLEYLILVSPKNVVEMDLIYNLKIDFNKTRLVLRLIKYQPKNEPNVTPN